MEWKATTEQMPGSKDRDKSKRGKFTDCVMFYPVETLQQSSLGLPVLPEQASNRLINSYRRQ